MDELNRFEKDLRDSEELQKKLDETIKRIVEEGAATSDGEVMVAATKELGYDISIAALEKAKAANEELDLKELEQVAGGDKNPIFDCAKDYHCLTLYKETVLDDNDGHFAMCVATWHCFSVLIHTEGGTKKEGCWSNYSCLIASK